MTSDNIVEISSETLEGNFYHFDQHKNESTHLSFYVLLLSYSYGTVDANWTKP